MEVDKVRRLKRKLSQVVSTQAHYKLCMHNDLSEICEPVKKNFASFKAGRAEAEQRQSRGRAEARAAVEEEPFVYEIFICLLTKTGSWIPSGQLYSSITELPERTAIMDIFLRIHCHS